MTSTRVFSDGAFPLADEHVLGRCHGLYPKLNILKHPTVHRYITESRT